MDLLSSLPDEVRCHILSFLTTKEAALTSVLSKKWGNLFALVPNLDFDDSEFLHPEDGKRERDGILESFMGFVDTVLALQANSPIHKFSLKCKDGVCEARMNRWICQVLQRGVSDLDLTIDLKDGYHLLQELLVSKTLVNLKLKSECCIYWWTGAQVPFLPLLKSLDIEAAKIFCDTKFELLLPSFPLLERLMLADMEWIGSDETVSSASITSLAINATGFTSYQNPKSISFDTPSLLHFGYSDLVAQDYPLVNMKNLLSARIILAVTNEQVKRIRLPNDELLEGDVVLKFGNVVKLMNGIQHVQDLHLHSDTLEVLSLCCESMPVFNNVKRLIIKSHEGRGWQAMPVLLRNCPQLEDILFEGIVHHVTDKCGDVCDCIYRKDKGRSLKSCPVKVIEIQGFRGTMKEMHMIDRFLDYFPCLKEMKICMDENSFAQLKNDPGLAIVILGMIEEFNEVSCCKVKLMRTTKR
ncbi:PREDICTED: F-box protein At3g03040-like [Camelina sativa]|uniref:F-box protein At3g03040-like n=1 Tax=Camelina sativa TaxID=90675 RepID=A0ABM0YT46_CAMSA|nr:PREDICTED: F-box protein At3g03040-like [Camelina sativa]